MIGWIIAAAAAVLLLILFLIYNNRFVVRSYELQTDRVERDLKILLLSDLHNKVYGKENAPLLECMAALHPDLIVIAGDLVDKRRPRIEVGVAFAERCAEIAPTYYVCGNHERERETFDEICSRLKKTHPLDNEWVETCGIKLLGITDYLEFPCDEAQAAVEAFEREEGYKIVAVHRPARFYSELMLRERKIDLQLSGHTHAGVAHIPFYGPIFAPGEWFFPKYAQGLYEENGVSMIVGGGLGNTRVPLRLFNFPEIVEISIFSKKTLAK